VAKFPHAREGIPWHGYPAWALNDDAPANRSDQKLCPPKEVFRKMEEAKLITSRQRKRLQKGDVSQPLMVSYHFPDFEVSWAGNYPWKRGFCFGSEDGRLLFSKQDGQGELGPSGIQAPSHEAINGVAFLEDSIAISTRSDVSFVTPPQNGRKGFLSGEPRGAHGIIATKSGYFVAPLGRSGLLLVKPEAGPQQPVATCGESLDFDFYRVISIPVQNSELLVCALRKGGVAALPVLANGDKRPISSITFPGLDVVDVCPLGEGLNTPAAAALGKNSGLILFRDAFSDRNPVTFAFDDIRGTAYRVFCDHGNLFVLTSKALYVLARLAQRFLDGEDVAHQPTPVRTLPLEAVDANLAGDHWLLVVLPDRVLRIDLEQLVSQSSNGQPVEDKGEIRPIPATPDWNSNQEEAMLTAVG
jgi:hypothetical protein